MERQAWKRTDEDSTTQPQECILADRAEVEDEEQHTDADWDYVRLRSSVTSQTPITSTPDIPWYYPVSRVWRHHICVSVPHADCRDHLANERTFLGYLRSSLILSVLGVLIAQLYRLQHAPHPDPVFGYYKLSTPLAAIMQSSALAVVLIGAHRFWRQQSAMARGKVHAGGWEVYVLGVYTLVLLVGLFIIHVSVTAYKSTR